MFLKRKTKENFCSNFFDFFRQKYFLIFFEENILVSKCEKTSGASVALPSDHFSTKASISQKSHQNVKTVFVVIEKEAFSF